jgi:hypothetical protein
MAARLHVQVADEPDAAGFARVRLTVAVEGPPSLEVEPPLLGDATDAWKVQQASAWHVAGGRAHWEATFDLRQVKPGLVPIPSVKIRCRENGTAPQEEAEWTDILTEIRPLRTAPLPTPTSIFGPRLLVAGLLTFLTFAVGCVGGFLIWRHFRRPKPRVLTHEERALADLDRLQRSASQPQFEPRAFAGALSVLLRRYIAERYALPATRQTTAEFLEKVRETIKIEETQRGQLQAFLERCDLVKFAGVSPSAEECRELSDFVRRFVQDGEKTKQEGNLPARLAKS